MTLARNIQVNILVARRPARGHAERFEDSRWTHSSDPVFEYGLRLVDGTSRELGERTVFSRRRPRTLIGQGSLTGQGSFAEPLLVGETPS